MNDIKERRKKRRNYYKIDNPAEIEIITDEIEVINDEIEIIDDKDDKNGNKGKILQKKNKLTRGEKVFLILNILVILSLIAYYGYRAIFYYKREHKVDEKITLKDKITNIKNITYKDDGLYEKNKYFYYKGKNVNNYVYYSGRLFRIISINNNIKLIEENDVTNLVYGLNENYDKSLIHTWLDNYLLSYKDYEIYLSKSNWCNKEVDINNYSCNDDLSDYVGLLSAKEYLDAGGVDSYLNNGSYFWLINYDKETSYFINSMGNINNYVKDNVDNYFSYGIRPVITLSSDLLYIKGDGSKDNPYIVEENTPSLLKNSSVGSYILYKDMKYRITNIDETGITLLLDENLDIDKNYGDAIKYLNNEFIKNLDKNDLVEQELITNYYSQENKYDYKEVVKTEKYYVIIPKIGDLFINNGDNYWLNTLSDKKINAYYIVDNGMFFGDLKSAVHRIKPSIKLKQDLIIKDGKEIVEEVQRILKAEFED